MNNDELMSKTKVSTAIRIMAIPSVISSLVTVLYNMADTFFVGQTNDALQVAAVSLTNPIFILFMAISNMLGMGGSALASIAMGKNDERKMKGISSFVLYSSLIIGIICFLILILFSRPILTLFGADSSTYDLSYGYLFHISYGALFIIFSAAASFVVRSEGNSKEAMIGNMIGTIANIILDPIFISVLDMKVAGAAIATTIGNILATIYYLYYFIFKSKHFSLKLKDMTLNISEMLEVCKVGLPTAIFSVLMSVATVILNQILVKYGNSAVAAIGIVFKINMFITFLQMGIANGVAPLLGYNFGSGDIKRFRAIESYTKKCCIITGVLSTLLFFVFKTQLITLFINDEEVIKHGVEMLLAYILSGPFIGILFVNMNALQSVGKANVATLLSILRQGLLLIPLLYLLDYIFGYNGVIYSQAICDILTVILSIVFWNICKRQLETSI